MKIASPSSVRGFTLVELMVVIVIMGIMASLVLLNIGGTDQRQSHASTRSVCNGSENEYYVMQMIKL